MALRFLADHCVPNLAIQKLRAEGHEVIRLKDALPPESPDKQVIAKAQELTCVLVSLNGDFADIVSYPPKLFKGIIAIQLHSHPEVLTELMKRLVAFVAGARSMRDYDGKLLIVEVDRIRVRE